MKNIVITGASTGIGFATTQSLIKRGYRVFGSVRKEADGARLIKELGKNFEPLYFDVTDDEAVKKETERLTQLIGKEGLYALVNNAGIAVAGPMMHLPIDELRRQFEVNVFGLLRTTQAFLPLLGAQKNCPYPAGKIFNISSVAGRISNPFMGAYSGSKHAVEALSDAMRMEFQLYGIDVIVIGPGVVKTPIWDKADEFNLDDYKDTDFYPSGERIKRFMLKISQQGFEQDAFGEMMADIIETKKPKARYALVYKKLINWTLPLLIPTRKFTSIVGKRLGLIK